MTTSPEIYPCPCFCHPLSTGRSSIIDKVYLDAPLLSEQRAISSILPSVTYAASVKDSDIYCHLGNGFENHDSSCALPSDEEAYGLYLDGNHNEMIANSSKGIFLAWQTLRQMMRNGNKIPPLKIIDFPHLKLRGLHLYLPGRKQMDFFLRILETAASLKYNTLFLEIGGGMEFKNHPEINGAWEKFIEKISIYPNEYAFLDTIPYPKDSIHMELGGGSFLLQNEIRIIIDKARLLHLEIIPEVQSLSHSYYTCLAHPEIAERQEDPYPDTTCPRNERTYEILFDVLDEVIELFHPKRIHIGHDEIYSLGLCTKCRNHTAADLLSEEIGRVSQYLESKGITTMMWGDKLLDIISGGIEYGGRRQYDRGKNDITYPAINEISKKIQLLNWYWELDPLSFEFFHRKGFQTIVGNFHPGCFHDSERKLAIPSLFGAEVSAWSGADESVMAHNGFFQNMALAANAMWWHGYGDCEKESTLSSVVSMMKYIRAHLSSTRLFHQDSIHEIILPQGKIPLDENVTKSLGYPHDFMALSSGQNIPVDKKSAFIQVLHCSSVQKEYLSSWLMPDPQHFHIGEYVIRTSWHEFSIPIVLWSNILHFSIDPLYKPLIAAGGTGSALLYYADLLRKGRDNMGHPFNLYRYTIPNPYPDEKILEIDIVGPILLFSVFLE